MICSYCKTENPKDTTICNFCEADLTLERPKLNPNLDDRAANLKQPELEKLHTYDLMRILTHVRAERTFMYKTMQIVRKAPDEAKNDNYDESNEAGQEMYRDLTAQKNIIEQILVDRMGYYPLRVDSKLLQALEHKMNRNKPKG